MNVGSAARVRQSVLVHAPLVIGWLKPIVLLPPSVVTGLSTSQLEAVLAHELAHVRRLDYVVNVIQSLIETLFFYHPAVWWLSRRVRIEREYCCDDLAVSLLRNRADYGRALLAISQLRGSSGVLSVAASGGSLLDRVRRLAVTTNQPTTMMSFLLAFAPLLALVIAASCVVLPAIAQTQTDTNSATSNDPPTTVEESDAGASTADSDAPERMSDEEQAVWRSLDKMGVRMRGAAGDWQGAYREFQNRFPRGSGGARRSNDRLREVLHRPVTNAVLFNVADEAWPQIAQLRSIQELEIGGSELAAGRLLHLKDLPNLRRLVISSCPVLPEHVREISELRQLEEIHLLVTIGELSDDEKRQRLGDLSPAEQDQVEDSRRAFGIDARDEIEWGEEAVLIDRALADFDRLTRLRRLKLANAIVSARGLAPLQSLPLEELYVNVAPDTGAAATILAKIRTLSSLGHLISVSDSELERIAELRELKDLDVGARRLTSNAIDHLLDMRQLERLKLDIHIFSNSDVIRFAGLPALRKLDLTHSQGPLTTEGIAALRAARPDLQLTVDDDLPRGSNAAGERVPAHLPDARPQAQPEPGDSSTLTEIITVTGRAFDPEGNAIVGARVFITSLRGGHAKLGETQTDAAGRYELRDVKLPLEKSEELGRNSPTQGRFEVFGQARGHGFAWQPAVAYLPDVAAPDSRFHTWPRTPPADDPTHVNLDLHFWPSAALRGRVVDGDGNPTPGTKVGLWNADRTFEARPDGGGDALISSFESLYDDRIMPSELRNRVTDDDGWFEYEALPVDCRYWLNVRPDGLPPRMVSAVVGEDPRPQDGADTYSSGMVLVFHATVEVPILVTHADTGEVAPDVFVNLAGEQGSNWRLTDSAGRATLKMPAGNHKLHVLAKTGTPYLPVRGVPHTVDASADDRTLRVELQPAAEVVVTVVDSQTGEPLEDVDFFELVDGQRSAIAWRSFTAPNLSHYNRPATDKNGKATLLFPAGEQHTFGAGLDRFPRWYLPSRDDDAVTIDGKQGRQEITLKLRKAER